MVVAVDDGKRGVEDVVGERQTTTAVAATIKRDITREKQNRAARDALVTLPASRRVYIDARACILPSFASACGAFPLWATPVSLQAFFAALAFMKAHFSP